MHIVQLANYVHPTSGGQRRVLFELGRRYVGAGHTCTRIVPGAADRNWVDGEGVENFEIRGVQIPTAGDYRAIVHRAQLRRLLESLNPDVVELSDKTTLAWVPKWLATLGVPTVLLSHERHDHLLAHSMPTWVPAMVWKPVIAGLTQAAAAGSARIVCASRYAAEPFIGFGEKVRRVPFGVDLDAFQPLDDEGVAPQNLGLTKPLRLVSVGRLAPEKRPDLAVATVRECLRRGVDVTLDVVGDGPLLADLQRSARGLPVTFHGHVENKATVASILRASHVFIATCPVETFGLAVLEGLASGLPVVAVNGGAVAEIIDSYVGAVVELSPRAIADGIERIGRRWSTFPKLCRLRAETYSWDQSAIALLGLFERMTSSATGERSASRWSPGSPGLSSLRT